MRSEAALPVSWRIRRLDDVCEIILGQSPPGSTYNTSGDGLPFYQGKSEFGDFYPIPKKWCSAPTKIAEAEDVLVSVRAPVGPTNLCPSRACIGRGLAAIRPRNGMASRYVLYALRATVSALADKATGTTFEAVNGKDLRSHLIAVAPLPEQSRVIAEIEKQFTRLDVGVSAFQRVQANLKRYRAALLRAACEGRLVPTEAEIDRAENHRKSFEPGEALLARLLAERRRNWKGRGKFTEPAQPDTSALPQLPIGWIWATIEQLSTVVRGASPRPAGDPRYFGGNVPWITVGPLTADNNPYLISVPGSLNELGREHSRYIEPETLLFTNSGATLGVPKISLIGGCINDGVAALLDVSYPLKLYLLYFLRTQTEKLRGLNQGAAQPNLNTTIIKEILVPLPPLAEQKRIVEEIERRLSVVEEVETLVTINLQRTTRLRQSVLHQAFSGRLTSKGKG